MKYQHKSLANGHWNELAMAQQLANVGSEVGRAISWQEKDKGISERAFFRALELMGLTVADPKNKHRLRELCRLREVMVDYFTGENIYNSSDEQWEKYFLPFNYFARRDSHGYGAD